MPVSTVYTHGQPCVGRCNLAIHTANLAGSYFSSPGAANQSGIWWPRE